MIYPIRTLELKSLCTHYTMLVDRVFELRTCEDISKDNAAHEKLMHYFHNEIIKHFLGDKLNYGQEYELVIDMDDMFIEINEMEAVE